LHSKCFFCRIIIAQVSKAIAPLCGEESPSSTCQRE